MTTYGAGGSGSGAALISISKSAFILNSRSVIKFADFLKF